MTILQYDPSHRTHLETMLVDYFTELSAGIPEPVIRDKILSLILNEHSQNILRIAIALENQIPMGFSIYQIDSPKSDWCKFPGWGSIREFYIKPKYRRLGHGSQLAAWTDQQLRKMGAVKLYLTADDAIPFWQHCGFSNSHEFCSNELEILTK